MNLLDKAIRAISPERALKRFEARRKLEILNSGYSRHGGSYEVTYGMAIRRERRGRGHR